MRKKLMALLGAGLMLTACGTTPETATESTQPSPTAPAELPPEAGFIAEFRAQNPDADRATDAQWLDVATAICDSLDTGATPNEIIDSMGGGTVTPEEAASAIVIATETMCTEHAPS